MEGILRAEVASRADRPRVRQVLMVRGDDVPQLRTHFTDADIARTRLKLEIDLMWEIVNSVQALQHTDGGLSFDPWRRWVRERVSRDGDLRAAMQTLMTAVLSNRHLPDAAHPVARRGGGVFPAALRAL